MVGTSAQRNRSPIVIDIIDIIIISWPVNYKEIIVTKY